MEQQSQQSEKPQTTASPDPVSAPKGFARCRSRKRSGARCRLSVQDPAVGLCFRHAALARETADALQDSTDLSKELLVVNEGAYGTTEHINAILSNVVELIARGRISPRRAAVITYALSLMLRSIVASDRKAANTPPEIIWDAPRPDRSGNKPATSTQSNGEANADAHKDASAKAHIKESYDAAEVYSRLRT